MVRHRVEHTQRARGQFHAASANSNKTAGKISRRDNSPSPPPPAPAPCAPPRRSRFSSGGRARNWVGVWRPFYFQRRLSTTRKVRNKKKKRGAHVKNHRARVHHAAREIIHLVEQAEIGQHLRLPLRGRGNLACARKPERKQAHAQHEADHRRRHLAARNRRRKTAQRQETGSRLRKIPRYIPPTVPASSAPGWFVKCRTMNRHASIGSHVTM